MTKCINIKHPDFKKLEREVNSEQQEGTTLPKIPTAVIAAKASIWQENNNTDAIPTAEDLDFSNVREAEKNNQQEKEDKMSDQNSSDIELDMDTQTLLIRCLKAMHLKIEDAEIVISLLRTENQMEEMLYWIKDNHERKPKRMEIIDAAIAIKQEITD